MVVDVHNDEGGEVRWKGWEWEVVFGIDNYEGAEGGWKRADGEVEFFFVGVADECPEDKIFQANIRRSAGGDIEVGKGGRKMVDRLIEIQ